MLTLVTDTGPEVFENAPLGLQIATLPYQEEFCLAVSKVIDQAINNEAHSEAIQSNGM